MAEASVWRLSSGSSSSVVTSWKARQTFRLLLIVHWIFITRRSQTHKGLFKCYITFFSENLTPTYPLVTQVKLDRTPFCNGLVWKFDPPRHHTTLEFTLKSGEYSYCFQSPPFLPQTWLWHDIMFSLSAIFFKHVWIVYVIIPPPRRSPYYQVDLSLWSVWEIFRTFVET